MGVLRSEMRDGRFQGAEVTTTRSANARCINAERGELRYALVSVDRHQGTAGVEPTRMFSA
jgi:hypothetical protein